MVSLNKLERRNNRLIVRANKEMKKKYGKYNNNVKYTKNFENALYYPTFIWKI